MNIMYGVLGIVLTMSLVKLPEMADHWDVSPFHDFVLVRQCMPRDLFFLIYGRFFHMAPGGSPKKNRDGTWEEGSDYFSLQKSRGYFWRRAFQQKFLQACTNAWLLYKWWLGDMLETVSGAIGALEGTTPESLRLVALAKELKDLKALQRKTRAQWLRALSTHLMAHCNEGCATRGGRGKKRPDAPKFQMTPERREHLQQVTVRQECSSPECVGSRARTSEGPKRSRRSKVSTACFCASCTKLGGVVICEACHADDTNHKKAFDQAAHRAGARGGSKRKPLVKRTPRL